MSRSHWLSAVPAGSRPLLAMLIAMAAPVAVAEDDEGVTTSGPIAALNSAGITLAGTVDTFFSYNFAGPERAPSTYRVFDASNTSFNVAYLELAVSMVPKPVGFRLDVGFGPVADLTSYDAANPQAPGVSEVLKHLQQAFASVAIGQTGWTIDAGKFVTTAGAEVIEARSNWNYSRSILFGYAIPFTHTGIRAAGPINSLFSLQASLVNGWDVVNDNNAYKTLGLSGTFTPPTGTTATLTYYSGVEGQAGAPWRNLIDFVLLQKVGEKLTLGLNTDFGREGSSIWYGGALMAEYHLTTRFRLAGRAEQLWDPDGARGIGSRVAEGTLTVAFAAGSNAELRAEVRADYSPDRIFLGSTSRSQGTAQLALLAWF